jgi:hypothetical protein
MKTGDVRATCIALIKTRTGTGSRRAPRPTAIGWKLENSGVSASELSELCAVLLDGDARAAGACSGAWMPSATLRALLGEYRRVRAGGEIARRVLPGARAARGRARAVNGRATIPPPY